MVKILELKKALSDFLEKELALSGFRLSQQSFYRKASVCEQIIHIAYIKRKYEVEVKANVDIRHNELEQLYNILLDESPNTPTATVGAEFGKLLGMKTSMVWSVKDHFDVPAVGKAILTTFWEVGQPFFENYGSLEKIFDILIADDLPIQSYCPIPHIRAKKALLALYLLGLYSNYEDLVNAKIMYLTSINNPYVTDFLNFADKLKEKIRTRPLP